MSLPDFRSRSRVGQLEAVLEGRFVHKVRKRALLNYVAPSSILVLGTHSSNQETLLQSLSRALTCARLDVLHVIAGNSDTTVLIAACYPTKDVVVIRAASLPNAVRRIERNATALRRLEQSSIAAFVPRELATVADGVGAIMTAESRIAGQSLLDIRPGTLKNRLFKEAALVLQAFRREHTVLRPLEPTEYAAQVGTAFEVLRNIASVQDEILIDQLEQEMHERLLCGKVWAMGPNHGDFKNGNIIIGANKKVVGFIDWDGWTEQGLPLLDEMLLCLYEDAKGAGRHLGASISALFVDGWLPFQTRLVSETRDALGIDSVDFATLKVLFWLTNVRDRFHWLVMSHEDQASQFVSAPLRSAIRLLEET
jgi:hypothetical protein